MASGNPENKQKGTPFASLTQLTAEDRAALAARNITTVEEFFARQTQDPQLIRHVGLPDSKAMNRVADAIGFAVARNQAEEKLAAAIFLTRHPWRTHLPDIIVGIVLLLLSIGLYRGCTARTALMAPHGLAPFQLIAANDVTVTGPDQDFAASHHVAGKYSKVRVPPGAQVDLSWLSSRPVASNAFDGRRILRVTLQSSPLAETLPSMLPAKASVMIAPKDKDLKGTLLDDVYLLDVQTQADNIIAVIAVSEPDAQTLASFEAKSDLILAGPIR